jgi:zinc protease
VSGSADLGGGIAPDARRSSLAAAVRPLPSPPRAYHFPAFERRTLANGLRLVVAPVPKLPVVTVLALVDAGAVCDPAGQEGVALLTARLLGEGTAALGADEVAVRFEALGTSFDASAGWDTAVGSMTVLTGKLEPALALMGEVVLAPAFAAREVERLKAERVAEILQGRAEPRGLADEMFERLLYAPESRFARPDGGSESTVAALTPEAVRDFYTARYRPGATTLILAGDVTADEAERLVERVFGRWAGSAPGRVEAAATPARTARAVHVIAKEDAPQSELRIGHVGLPRTHPDFFPVTVMNAVLGGLFSSRINLNLREEHAYTYGAHSGFDWRRAAGPFVVDAAVKSDVTEAAAREVLKEIDRMRAEEISESELSLATSYLDGVFPIRYETTAAIASALASLVAYELPDDYFDAYRMRVRAVTAADVRRAAEAHLHPDRLQLLAVGDPAAVEAPLRALDFGPVTVYDVEGRPRTA